MSTQITELDPLIGESHLNLSLEQTPILSWIDDLLTAGSSLKKGVDSYPLTVVASRNSLLGAMATDGSLETMDRIYRVFRDELLDIIQKLAKERGQSEDDLMILTDICKEIKGLYPFAHRTTVQAMINGHTKEESDLLLEKNFLQSINDLDAVGYKPAQVVVNQDPHFVDYDPSFWNGEIKKILIGGKSTLRTGYQFNVTNISPIGLFVGMGLAPKRQKNHQDLGDLRYSIEYGKAIDRVKVAGVPLLSVQGDKGLAATATYAASKAQVWQSTNGESSEVSDFTEHVFFVSPWTSHNQTKAELIAAPELAEVMVVKSDLLRSQYTGDQPIVKEIYGPDPKCKTFVETAIVVLHKRNGEYLPLKPSEVQIQLVIFTAAVQESEEQIEILKKEYFSILRFTNNAYKERGLLMKLNSKSHDPLAREDETAWCVRKQYHAAERSKARANQKRDAYLRQFEIYEIGVDEASLSLIKGAPCKLRTQLIYHLKTLSKAYGSRWCIEPAFETVEYLFPVHYKGNSSDSHFRIFVLQECVFNSYRVAQILHLGNTKPQNWRPWDPKNKLRCRQLSAAEQRSFSTKGYILRLLRETLKNYFCRAFN